MARQDVIALYFYTRLQNYVGVDVLVATLLTVSEARCGFRPWDLELSFLHFTLLSYPFFWYFGGVIDGCQLEEVVTVDPFTNIDCFDNACTASITHFIIFGTEQLLAINLYIGYISFHSLSEARTETTL